MAYVLGQMQVPQYEDANGNPATGYKLAFFLTGTTTRTPVYSDSSGTALSDGTTTGVVNLNSLGQPETAGGTACSIYFDTAITYKYQLYLSDGTTAVGPTVDPFTAEGTASTLQADLATDNSTTKGSNMIGHYDSFAASYLKTQSDINNGIPVSAFRFIANTAHAGIRAATNTDDLTSNFADIVGSGARKITFPCGTYNLDSVEISADFREWEGENPGGVILKGNTDVSDIITISGNVVTLKNIRVTADTGVRVTTGSGIVIDQGGAITQNRVNLIDCQVEDQPGDGIVGVMQEHGRFINVWAERNGGRGFYFHDNATSKGIACYFLNCRADSNAGTYQWQITNQVGYIFDNCESLKGTGTYEMFLQSGTGHHVNNVDIERTTVAGTGMLISGAFHKVNGGTIQKLLNGIELNTALNCEVINPRLIGDAGTPMTTGINVVSTCEDISVSLQISPTNVTTSLSDSGSKASKRRGLVYENTDIVPRRKVVSGGASHTPDLSAGLVIEITLDQALTINGPTNAQIGMEVIFILIQDGTGGWNITWNGTFKFLTAWSDTGNVATARSMVSFKYDGSAFVESQGQSAYHT